LPNKKEKAKDEPNVIFEDNTVYGGVGISVYPEYIGGIQKFKSYIKENFIISKKARKSKGKIKANFIIEKDGTLNDVIISEDLGFGTAEELIRVLKLSRKWTPAEEQGKKIKFHFEAEIFMTTDTVKKIFDINKISSRIDSIEIKRITKFKD
jgi:protein TonB